MENFIEILMENDIKSSSGKTAKEIFQSLLDEIEAEANNLKESNQIKKENNEFYQKRAEVDALDLDYRKIQLARYENLNAANYEIQKASLLNVINNLSNKTGGDFSDLKKLLEG